MDNNLKEKLDLIQKINTDDSRFILNVYDSYEKNKKSLENKFNTTSIILKDNFSKSSPNIIDLDEIYAKPYFYTKMRLYLNGIIENLLIATKSTILKNPSKFCKQLISHNCSKKIKEIEEDKIDIVDFIKILNEKFSKNPSYNSGFIFIAKSIDEETIFKEEQLQKAIEIMSISSKEEQYEKIYDEIYSYMKKDFVSNNYCDFKNNKCVAQRHFTLYPINRKNGCCFTQIKTCPHLKQGGACDVECISCRLFSCPYLSRHGIKYFANEFVLLKAFLTKKQRKHFVFDFYMPKEKVLKRLLKSK